MGEARRASVRGLSTDRQELNLIPRKAPSRLTNRLVRTRMLGGVRGRGLVTLSYSIYFRDKKIDGQEQAEQKERVEGGVEDVGRDAV